MNPVAIMSLISELYIRIGELTAENTNLKSQLHLKENE